jgi:hypothetical protein
MAAGTPYCPACFLTPVTRPESMASPTEPWEGPAPAEPRKGSPSAGCSDPDCAHRGRPPATGCRHCGLRTTAESAAGGSATALDFGWGPVSVDAGRPLLVGRENSPIADRLGRYSNISRRHAEISSDGTSLTVVDLDSMNGTFLNGERLAPGVATPARAGDRLRFAAELEARVTGAGS